VTAASGLFSLPDGVRVLRRQGKSHLQAIDFLAPRDGLLFLRFLFHDGLNLRLLILLRDIALLPPRDAVADQADHRRHDQYCEDALEL
jgi:hypothetical protein